LQQAEHGLATARRRETEAHRAYDCAPQGDRERLGLAWQQARRARESAASLFEQRQRARASLLAAIPGARVDARRTSGELAALEDQVRRQLLRARREAQAELDRLVHDLARLAGDAAVPPEEEA